MPLELAKRFRFFRLSPREKDCLQASEKFWGSAHIPKWLDAEEAPKPL